MRDELLDEAIDALSSIPDVEMDPDSLADDVYLLAIAWPDERDFATAVASTARALKLLLTKRPTTASLKYALNDWKSFHYQSKRSQGAKADMRVVFQYTETALRVLGFGHRHIPIDFYERLANIRL